MARTRTTNGEHVYSTAIFGYPITEGQKNAIAVPKKFDYLYFNPVKDNKGRWFIFEQEREVALKHFGWAADLKLEEYVAPPDELFPTT